MCYLQDKIGWDLRQAWDDALRTGQETTTTTVLVEINTSELSPINHQRLRELGIKVELSDGFWLQLEVPFNRLNIRTNKHSSLP